jgi:hypothetical protein
VTRQDTPEKAARRAIDAALEAAGWDVQDISAVNLHAGKGVAIREFPLQSGHGYADYLLYIDGRAVGVVEAMLWETRHRLRRASAVISGWGFIGISEFGLQIIARSEAVAVRDRIRQLSRREFLCPDRQGNDPTQRMAIASGRPVSRGEC